MLVLRARSPQGHGSGSLSRGRGRGLGERGRSRTSPSPTRFARGRGSPHAESTSMAIHLFTAGTQCWPGCLGLLRCRLAAAGQAEVAGWTGRLAIEAARRGVRRTLLDPARLRNGSLCIAETGGRELGLANAQLTLVARIEARHHGRACTAPGGIIRVG